jgi:hypothetical protein
MLLNFRFAAPPAIARTIPVPLAIRIAAARVIA